jgi:Acetyltransferase (GNAT) domain
MIGFTKWMRAAWERHRERHRPSGFGFALADRVDFLDPASWDAVTAGGSFFISRDYLRTLETEGPDRVSQRYALLFRGRTPVAAVAAQWVDVTGADLATGETNRARRLFLDALRLRILVCGDLATCGLHGVAFARGEDPADLYRGVADALYRIRRAEKLAGQPAFILIKEVPEDESAGIETLARFSYRSLHTDPNMVLTLEADWRCFEDYAASLKAKYRKAALEIDRSVCEAGCRVESLLDLDGAASEIHALYTAVRERARLRLAALPVGFLPAVARAAGPERFRCTVIRRGDRLLGFVTTVKDRDTAVGYYLGVDYDVNEEVPIYLRLIQAVISDAIDLGCRRISYGRTSLEPKARIGARPMPVQIWVRHRIPQINVIARELLGAVPHAEPPDRQPFREPQE